MYEMPFRPPDVYNGVIHIPNLTLNFSAKLRGLTVVYVVLTRQHSIPKRSGTKLVNSN